ncbi:hypothetical protein [Bradyrhizobium japonicum]|uniref:hypothetical protein n=1 Tax=Bradyrhizobium japonicum TaxID=375 RepID=UPI001E4F13B8|nr:hypothetical protein [Bradyrhizobium japonicum]MCD9825852.1 hypothetical protein [Bradyrhizobium japonicum]MCD9898796.1 hypothetical protein [Bradyrhizobium japonicum]MCP1768819.1 hypothetical protein [Bradyrhizobium japonicum]MCP1794997.1 hypothetical protein [Bradyrhizobium japonicum]MCP1811481.1 hypothetical protein [Bradyrhizobium japonicum]
MGHRIAGVVIALNKTEFRMATEGKEELLKALGNPYTTCFHWLVQSVLELMKPNKKETLKFVHENNNDEKEAKASFEFIAKDANPNKVPMRLLFGGKREQMPLQSADICVSAWNKDPVFGVIGIQSGPRDKGPQWLPSSHGSRGWDAGGGDDW